MLGVGKYQDPGNVSEWFNSCPGRHLSNKFSSSLRPSIFLQLYLSPLPEQLSNNTRRAPRCPRRSIPRKINYTMILSQESTPPSRQPRNGKGPPITAHKSTEMHRDMEVSTEHQCPSFAAGHLSSCKQVITCRTILSITTVKKTGAPSERNADYGDVLAHT